MNNEVIASIRRQLRRLVDNPADVEELTQEVLLKLHRSGPEEDEAIGPWVRRVARNTAIDHLRGRRLTDEMPEVAVHPAPPNEGTARVASWLPVMLQGVPEPYRTAVMRVDFEGVSQQELAAELGLSPSGARTRVQRGRVLLRQVLLDCCPVVFEEGEVVDTGLQGCGSC